MADSDRLQLVVTTPEKTVLSTPADSLQFPLYDGSIGILPKRAPLVGRLGYGELKVTIGSEHKSYFIDSGFVQIVDGVVSLLTERAIAKDDLQRSTAEEALTAANALPASTDEEYAHKLREQERARRMLDIVS
ncbi:FoF1 ATP synthase subunit delta/epsilon [Thalassoroseus pseudoceratinae]|uniref:FoF1 ATP synthase subunit delta/epsilon n=1 Tax=Thalassoroseus pseudoceratinae TaxID=2713176 RepID=UPI0014215599|nr:F0F1 ATP synthase subunit epsilon [Thalassoroseus pseudoceratinae]